MQLAGWLSSRCVRWLLCCRRLLRCLLSRRCVCLLGVAAVDSMPCWLRAERCTCWLRQGVTGHWLRLVGLSDDGFGRAARRCALLTVGRRLLLAAGSHAAATVSCVPQVTIRVEHRCDADAVERQQPLWIHDCIHDCSTRCRVAFTKAQYAYHRAICANHRAQDECDAQRESSCSPFQTTASSRGLKPPPAVRPAAAARSGRCSPAFNAPPTALLTAAWPW